MKRYLSVFEMITRSSIYRVLLILAGMMAAESAFFYFNFMDSKFFYIEEYIDPSYYSIVFKIAYLLVTIVIVLSGMNLGSVQSYTLQRLRIKENRIYWLQALYNLFVYVILWGTQLITVLINLVIFQKNLPEGAVFTNQTMFLAFYRNAFMHTIFPLEDGPGWWMLVFTGITSALAAAEFTKLQRNGKFGFELLFFVAAVMIFFPRALSLDIAFMIFAICIVYMVIGMRILLRHSGGE